MAKINPKYLSLLDFLKGSTIVGVTVHNRGNSISGEEAPRKTVLPDDSWPRIKQIQGGFQPLADTKKGFFNTFKPYKSRWYILYDFWQFMFGVGNILSGAATFSVAMVYLLLMPFVELGYFFSDPNATWEGFKANMATNSAIAASWLIEGASRIIRGVAQVITTPLTWASILLIRGPLTAYFGWQKVKENDGVKRLVQEGREAIERQDCQKGKAIVAQLHEKVKTGLDQEQDTGINQRRELDLYNSRLARGHKKADYKAYYSEYFSLFEPASEDKPLVDAPEDQQLHNQQ